MKEGLGGRVDARIGMYLSSQSLVVVVLRRYDSSNQVHRSSLIEH